MSNSRQVPAVVSVGVAKDVAALKGRFDERRERRRLSARASAAPANLTPRHYEVAVYFADTPPHLYQLRQWLEPLQILAQAHPVVLVTRSARTTRALQRETNLPVVYAGAHSDLDPLVESQLLKVALYVNHNTANFSLLWHPDLLHVYIGHGESDKIGISASNQLKAYDYCFVSGQAAIDRIKHRLINYDTDARLIEIGRPQVDHLDTHSVIAKSDRTVVLYAPSWEGDRPANRYGSLASHGELIISSLLADGSYQVIFRPHPLSGTKSADFATARDRVAALIEQANRREPQAGHVVDTGLEFGWQLDASDACIADISAVAFDWLPTRKPLVVTQPTSLTANVDPRGIAGMLPLLRVEAAGDAPSALAAAMTEQARTTLDALATYYFGDTSRGASTTRWLAAIDQVSAARDDAIIKRDSPG